MLTLIADPSSVLRHRVRNAMRHAGLRHDLVEAADGAQAVALMSSRNVRLVNTGTTLDHMHATQLARLIRRTYSPEHVQILLLSLPCSYEDVLQAVDSGIDGFILMPFENDVLIRKVEQALRRVRHPTIHKLFHHR